MVAHQQHRERRRSGQQHRHRHAHARSRTIILPFICLPYSYTTRSAWPKRRPPCVGAGDGFARRRIAQRPRTLAAAAAATHAVRWSRQASLRRARAIARTVEGEGLVGCGTNDGDEEPRSQHDSQVPQIVTTNPQAAQLAQAAQGLRPPPVHGCEPVAAHPGGFSYRVVKRPQGMPPKLAVRQALGGSPKR